MKEHVAVLVVVPLDFLQRRGGVRLGRPEVGLGVLELLPCNSELARDLRCAHPCRQRLCLVLHEVVKVPFEVGADADVHAQQEGLLDLSAVVFPCG